MLFEGVETSQIAETWGEASGTDRHNASLLRPHESFRHFFVAKTGDGDLVGFVGVRQKRPGVAKVCHFLTLDHPLESAAEKELLRNVVRAQERDPELGMLYARVRPELAGAFRDAGFREADGVLVRERAGADADGPAQRGERDPAPDGGVH